MQANKGLKRKILLGIALLAGFMLIIFVSTSYLKSKNSVNVCDACDLCQWNVSVYDIIPILVALAFFIGAGVYYLMLGKVESKDESLKKNTVTILNLLNEDERKIIDLLVEGNGKALQSNLTRLPGMNKLKSHRTVKRLQLRGVVEIQRYGKTNIVILNKEIKEGLCRNE